jgi:glycosyltransferase involved in cell wall biosynthesis
MESNQFFVSVIIPVYNGEAFLAESVASIRRQDYQPLEIIIVDDGSTDGTAALVASLGEDIRYVYQCNRGPAAARNTGLAMARGEVITFLDADDYWPPSKLQIQLARLNDDPKIEAVLGRVQYTGLFTAAERKIRFEGPDNTLISVHLGSGVFRKSVFDKVGVFDETLRYYEDHDWFLRVREQGISMIIIEETTLHYRLHEHNMSRHKDITEFNIVKVLKKSLDRRRQQNNGLVPSLPKFFDFDEVKVSCKK